MVKRSQQKIKEQVEKLMIQNRRRSGKYIYTVPSPSSYPFQWFWDSCFHAIILSYLDISLAKKELLALASKQFKNGMIPHMIYWEDPRQYNFAQINWGRHRTSSIVQPPMLAYAVWSIYEKDGDKQFLKQMLPVITRFHNYLLRDRDPHKHHLVGLVHPDESGEDNSPRFDSVLQLKPKQSMDANFHRRLVLINQYRIEQFRIKHHMANFHWVRDVPFNAILVANLQSQSLIAGELSNLKLASGARQQSEEVAAAMRQYMLDGTIMMSTMGLNYHHIRVKTWAMFAPMFANILTDSEVESLVKNHLMSQHEFKTAFSVPTVSIDEPSFDPSALWRGPVWYSTNWFIYKGLLNYALKKEAEVILKNTLKLFNLHGFREQFNPLTGEPLGAENFTWGGLVLDMLANQ